jgi:hypothetical protein
MRHPTTAATALTTPAEMPIIAPRLSPESDARALSPAVWFEFGAPVLTTEPEEPAHVVVAAIPRVC